MLITGTACSYVARLAERVLICFELPADILTTAAAAALLMLPASPEEFGIAGAYWTICQQTNMQTSQLADS